MSSKNLENSVEGSRMAGQRFLAALKTGGPKTTTALSVEMGITHEAARQQLVKLAAEGLVESVREAKGVGRPAQVWRLTEEANRRFPDAHAELTLQLIQNIRTELGEDAMERLIQARETQTRRQYRTELEMAEGIEARVAGLAAIRSREGYMAEYRADGDGYLLVENHCPICAAALACQGFCRAELRVFQEILGDTATVTRVEHIPAGARRCAYRIVSAGEGTEGE